MISGEEKGAEERLECTYLLVDPYLCIYTAAAVGGDGKAVTIDAGVSTSVDITWSSRAETCPCRNSQVQDVSDKPKYVIEMRGGRLIARTDGGDDVGAYVNSLVLTVVGLGMARVTSKGERALVHAPEKVGDER